MKAADDFQVSDGRGGRPKTARGEGGLSVSKFMDIITGRRALTMLVVAGTALAAAGAAGASVVVPAVPVASYGDSLLSGLATAITPILPYAAGITVFAIGVGMLKRWLGHRKATHV